MAQGWRPISQCLDNLPICTFRSAVDEVADPVRPRESCDSCLELLAAPCILPM